jgi:cardiolipin-specific phospholipase
LGFFYKNYEAISRAKGWKIWSLDLLGMGRSTRPPFKIAAKDQQGKITEAENWFIDALEEWRIQRKLEKFTLLGHSLGGYLAVAYALKYPGHLNKLILASPVGIPEDPYAVNADMPEPESSTLANEFTQDQEDIVNHSNPNLPASPAFGGNTALKDNNNFLNARKKAEKEAAQSNGAAKGPNSANTPGAPRRPIAKWITYLWDANISPFSLVRWSGPLGPRLVSGWTSRRFSHLPPDEAQALHDYSYSLFKQRGSGEYALAYILAPGAFARSPLIRRIAGVGNQVIPQTNAGESDSDSSSASTKPVKENGIPIVLMYGENDWMDIAGGYAAEQKIKDEDKRIKAEQSEKSPTRNSDAKVMIIKRAGHHVYLDGWEEFNEVMLEEMEDVNRRARRAAR